MRRKQKCYLIVAVWPDNWQVYVQDYRAVDVHGAIAQLYRSMKAEDIEPPIVLACFETKRRGTPRLVLTAPLEGEQETTE